MAEEDGARSKFDALAKHLKALGSGTRLEILHALRVPRSVSEIRARPSIRREDARASRALSRQAITHHLQALLDAGFATRAQEGEKESDSAYVVDRQRLFALVDEMRALTRLKAVAGSTPAASTMAGPDADAVRLPEPPRLVVVYGAEEGIAYPLRPDEMEVCTVGRDPKCPVRLDHDPFLSSQHCSIALDDEGRFVVRDLGSRNGTWVNFTPLPMNRPQPLRAGDVLTVGRTHLVLQA